MDKEKTINYWVNSSDNDFKTMEHLFKSKDYPWSLFMGHLVIERLLKAYYLKTTDSNVPFTHDLLRIVEKTGLKLDEKQKNFLDLVTSFNLKARYEDYKMSFRKKCTKKFTSDSINQIMEFRKWIKKLL